MSNIHGLSSSKSKDKKDDDKEEFSVGGAQSSTAVLRPTGGDKGNTSISDLLNQAKSQSGQGKADAEMSRCIILYANGFKLGEDGEFRDISDPKNKKFTDQIKNGNVPDELHDDLVQAFGPVGNLGLNLVDRTRETFTPPPPKFNFATSVGSSLGSGTQETVDLGNLTSAEYTLDPNEPQTTLQVVLHNRKKVRITLNHTTTVGQLYQHVMHVAQSGGNFVLMDNGGFPPKAIKDTTQTIKDAGLVGSSVQQRLT